MRPVQVFANLYFHQEVHTFFLCMFLFGEYAHMHAHMCLPACPHDVCMDYRIYTSGYCSIVFMAIHMYFACVYHTPNISYICLLYICIENFFIFNFFYVYCIDFYIYNSFLILIYNLLFFIFINYLPFIFLTHGQVYTFYIHVCILEIYTYVSINFAVPILPFPPHIY